MTPVGTATVELTGNAVPPLYASLQDTVFAPVCVLFTMLDTTIVPAEESKGDIIVAPDWKMSCRSPLEMEDAWATRSATLDASLISFCRHSSALHTTMVPRRSTERTGAMSANSIADRPLVDRQSRRRFNTGMRPNKARCERPAPPSADADRSACSGATAP